MTIDSARPTASFTEGDHFLCDDWFDPLEVGVRARIRGFIEDLLEAELDAALRRARYERRGSRSGCASAWINRKRWAVGRANREGGRTRIAL
jgi:hypothetical protein